MEKKPLEILLDRLWLGNFQDAGKLLATDYAEVTTFGFVNAHAINLAWDNPCFLDALLDCSFLFRDGVGVELALRLFGRKVGDNNNGTDLIASVLTSFSDRRVLILGSSDAILGRVVSVLEAEYGLTDVSAMNGFDYCTDQYIAFLQLTRPRLVILAMGMPKQEMLAREIKKIYRGPLSVINGGAILSFLAGEETRAPGIVRRFRLEWLWRLSMDPRRLFRRYVPGGIIYGLRLCRYALFR